MDTGFFCEVLVGSHIFPDMLPMDGPNYAPNQHGSCPHTSIPYAETLRDYVYLWPTRTQWCADRGRCVGECTHLRFVTILTAQVTLTESLDELSKSTVKRTSKMTPST